MACVQTLYADPGRVAAFFRELLAEGGAGAEGAMVQELDVFPALEDDLGEPFFPLGAPMPEAFPDRAPEIRRQPLRYTRPDGLGVFSVYFDGCVHATGRQRAFVDCPWHQGEHCRRYVFVHHFSGPLEAAAWLTAWAFVQPRPGDKAAHYLAEPGQVAIQAIVAEMG